MKLDRALGDNMEAEHSLELIVAKTHVSATISLVYVSETQMATSISPANDARMKDATTLILWTMDDLWPLPHVQPWSPSFKPHEHVINQVIGWIRLPKLPARYYHKSIIRSTGSVFGEVIRADCNTDSDDLGKFVRLAVIIDLVKPLTSKIQVDGEFICGI
ncbi:hypothetical protein K1719_032245 [Acacia pycnantha]|nr:hypothetical protein K1719_032245 [Acacia pycnantha]